MSESNIGMADDLTRLWQETALPATDPEQLSRRVARMNLARFDQVIDRRNLREYIGVIAILLMTGSQMYFGGDRVTAGMGMAGGLFVGVHLWWQHRREPPLDPAMNARDYQRVLVERMDHQIRLLSSVRYWYLLPLYLPSLRMAATAWTERPWSAVLLRLIVTVLFAGIAWLNEYLGVRFLRHERARIDSIYESDEGSGRS